MRGADDPDVRKQAIDKITKEILDLAKELRRLGVSEEEIEIRLRKALE